ncbi:MAG TPA: hypothetical protein VNK43_10030 [Gemmatimonadales bacterium]|nr:hypothetical protein [Gemmatimonadales bacterium]
MFACPIPPALVACALALACRSVPAGGVAPEPQEPAAPAILEVENLTASDATIYVVRGGERIRLGLATASSRKRFTIPGYLVKRPGLLNFLADPVGGPPHPLSDEIAVAPGDTVVVTIQP